MKSYKSDAGMWAQAKAGLADVAARVPIPHGTEGLVESCWLLLTSVVAVPLVCLVPGGSAVLGFLVGSQPLRFCTSRLRPKALSPVSALSCLLPLTTSLHVCLLPLTTSLHVCLLPLTTSLQVCLLPLTTSLHVCLVLGRCCGGLHLPVGCYRGSRLLACRGCGRVTGELVPIPCRQRVFFLP